MLVSIILPSTGRHKQLVACIEQMFATCQGLDVELVCVIENDLISKRKAEALAKRLPVTVIYRQEHKGPVYGWNQGAAAAHGDAFVLAGDDLWAHEGWLEEALNRLELRGGAGLVGFNDLHKTLDPNTDWWDHFLVTRDYCIEGWGGVFCVPHYKHYCLDIEAGRRARRDGMAIYAPKAVLEHRHFSFGAAPRDATYNLGIGAHITDWQTMELRQTMRWPTDYEGFLTYNGTVGIVPEGGKMRVKAVKDFETRLRDDTPFQVRKGDEFSFSDEPGRWPGNDLLEKWLNEGLVEPAVKRAEEMAEKAVVKPRETRRSSSRNKVMSTKMLKG